jgi:hypothetical protein
VGVSDETEAPGGLALMLVPYSFIDGIDDITGKPYMTVKTHMRRAVQIGNKNTAAERRQFYQLLLKIDWLPSPLRRVVMAELGLSLRDQNRRIKEAEAITLRQLVKEREQAMRAQEQRPQGGIHEAAATEITVQRGMTPDALKQRLRRSKQRARKKMGDTKK